MRSTLGATLALSLALGSQAWAQAAMKPRESVGRIAAAIEARFYDEARAKAIAGDLRAEAADGAYDRLTDPRDFASAMSARLRPLDGHFAVRWSPPSAARAQRGPDLAAYAAQMRRTNFGFRAVEILPGDVARVDMRYFGDFSPESQEARKAADAVLAMISGADAVIFDLRDNGGGSPAMVGYLIGHFVPADADIYNTFKARGRPDESERPPVEITAPRRLETPLYVLTSGRTGSAAESFAYTLQAAKRAVVVGEASGGGANPGGPADVGDGLSVFVSTGTPVNPITGRNWEGTGVVPDVQVPADQALERAQALALADLAKAPLDKAALTENRWVLEALGPAAALPAAALAGYGGTYGVYEVVARGGVLILRQGRRPEKRLKPLNAAGLFVVEADPLRRVRFDQGALVVLGADGSSARHQRSAGAP